MGGTIRKRRSLDLIEHLSHLRAVGHNLSDDLVECSAARQIVHGEKLEGFPFIGSLMIRDQMF